jgi:hypothetical protein
MLMEPLPGDATEDNLGLVVPCPLSKVPQWQAADHGDAEGDGFGVVGHRCIKVFV